MLWTPKMSHSITAIRSFSLFKGFLGPQRKKYGGWKGPWLPDIFVENLDMDWIPDHPILDLKIPFWNVANSSKNIWKCLSPLVKRLLYSMPVSCVYEVRSDWPDGELYAGIVFRWIVTLSRLIIFFCPLGIYADWNNCEHFISTS